MWGTFNDPTITGVTPFQQHKLEKEAKRNWNLFYKRNGDRFYKDRHWTVREFGELLDAGQEKDEKKILLEVGCGVGNFVFPLVQEQTHLFVYGCDFAEVAVQMCRENPASDPEKCSFFVCDLTMTDFCEKFLATAAHKNHTAVDLISIVFVLSAIHPEKHCTVVKNLKSVLKPGGTVLFRDYAINDMAMRRFKPENKLSDRFYVRQDGTRAFYFETEQLEQLFREEDFETIENAYVQRSTINLKEGINSERKFLQAKFRRPV